jgi:hypothetical protein
MSLPRPRSRYQETRILDAHEWMASAERLCVAGANRPGLAHATLWREYVVACMGNLAFAVDNLDSSGATQLNAEFNEGLRLATEDSAMSVRPILFTAKDWRTYVEHVIDPHVAVTADTPLPASYAELYHQLRDQRAWFTDLASGTHRYA